jgi:hypothetical protein
MAKPVTAETFAAKLLERGADSAVVEARSGQASIRAINGKVTMEVVFRAEGGFVTAINTATREEFGSMAAVIRVLGVRPDKPFKAGYTNGGSLRPYATREEALDAVQRLWIDGIPQVILTWEDGSFRRTDLFDQRPVAVAA